MSRPPLPEEDKRVRLSGGPHIKPEHKRQIKIWAMNRGISIGDVLDQLVEHAHKTNFNPIIKHDN